MIGMLVMAALLTAAPSSAQDTEANPQSVVQKLQAKDALTDEERAALRAWIAERAEAIVTAAGRGSAKPVAELRGAYDGTPAFKQAYIESYVEVVSGLYKRADLAPASQLIALLTVLNDPAAHDLLLEALKDKRVAIRTSAAVGLRTLRAALAQLGSDAVTRTITALHDAGRSESSAVALKAIYQALDYASLPSAPDSNANAAAVLDLLVARAQQYDADRTKASWGADTPGLKLAGQLRGSLNEADRNRLINATARIARAAVLRYANELYAIEDADGVEQDIRVRDSTEYLIAAAEKLLGSLLSPDPQPDVSAKMRSERDKPILLKLEWKKWADLVEKATGADVQLDGGESDDASGG